MARLRKTRGTTLIETVSALSVMSLAVLAVLSLYDVSLGKAAKYVSRNKTIEAVAVPMARMDRDMRAAASVVSSHGSFTTDGDTIVLRAPSFNTQGVIEGSYDYIVYNFLNSNSVARSIYPAGGSHRQAESARVIGRNISALSYTYTVHDFFTGDGTTRTFQLSGNWLATPVCRWNGGTVTSGVSYSAQNRTATLSAAPTQGTQIEFVYDIAPNDTTGLGSVSEVKVSVTGAAEAGSGAPVTLSASVRLRNNR